MNEEVLGCRRWLDILSSCLAPWFLPSFLWCHSRANLFGQPPDLWVLVFLICCFPISLSHTHHHRANYHSFSHKKSSTRYDTCVSMVCKLLHRCLLKYTRVLSHPLHLYNFQGVSLSRHLCVHVFSQTCFRLSGVLLYFHSWLLFSLIYLIIIRVFFVVCSYITIKASKI